ncbi:unnamed protein product [Peniophora sp. CBMAI 1063]|nr:unnamed protein product [Peniophora sp. CBMAI 1063]
MPTLVRPPPYATADLGRRYSIPVERAVWAYRAQEGHSGTDACGDRRNEARAVAPETSVGEEDNVLDVVPTASTCTVTSTTG